MKSKPDMDAAVLRQAAEARHQAIPAGRQLQTGADARRLQHEQEVRQIELEMQNEQLRADRGEIEFALERYSDLFDFSPVGYFILAPDGAIRLVNLTSEKFSGFGRAELVGRHFQSFFSEPDRPAVSALLAQVFATGARQSGEATLVNKDRTLLNVHLEAMLAPDGERCRVAILDITARKRAEEIMLKERNFSQASLDSLPGLFYLFDDQGHFLRLNKNFEKVSGYSADELSRLTPMDFFDGADRQRIADAIQQVFQKGEKTVEAEFVSKNLTRTPFFFTGKLFQFEQKKCVMGMGIDITERKRAEEGMRVVNEQIQAILGSITDAFFALDDNMVVTYFNAAAERLLGRASADILGRNLFEAFPEAKGSVFEKHYAEAIRDRKGMEFEHYFAPHENWYAVRVYPRSNGISVYFQTTTERKRVEAVQRFLAESSGGDTEESFFRKLARFLAQNLGMDFVCIDRLEGDLLNARTVAVWHNGHFEDNVTYALKDTPCGDAVGKQVCCFPANVCRLFPNDQVLKDLRAESYIGVTLWSHDGKPIGLIAVISRNPLANRPQAEATLGMVAVRAAGELERQQAEQALRESHAFNESLLKSIPLGMDIVDEEGNILFRNSPMQKGSGKSALGQKCWELYRDDRRQCVECPLKQPIKVGETKTIESDGVFGGRIFEITHTGMVYQGKPALLEIFRDITGRRKAEESLRQLKAGLERRVAERTAKLESACQSLRESEERYRILFDRATDGIFLLAEDGKLVAVNRSFARMHGYSVKEMLRMTLKNLDTPETHKLAPERLRRLLAGKSLSFEVEHYHKDGHVFPLEVAASRISVGGKSFLQCFHRDITGRKQSEEALRQSERELADFFSESPLGLLWVKPDRHILRVNQVQLKLFGRSEKEIMNVPVCRFFIDPAAVMDLCRRLAKGETVNNYHLRLRQKNRSIKHVLVDANGLWEKNRLIHTRWFVRDITRRLELEREILSISEREQRRLGHDLHDDLCQQLAGIEFISQTLAKQLTAARVGQATEVRQIANLARNAMSQTRDLAHGLSSVSLEAEGLMVALKALAVHTKKVFRRDCYFRCGTPVLGTEHAVGIHLYRIAQEAVSNAVKHGKPGRIDIALTAKGRNLVLTVSDDGLGIPEKLPGRKGLGLNIMEYRSRIIGASLVVRRNPQGGTTVTCSVPDGLSRHPKKKRA